METYVVCDTVGEGLRPTEAAVEVRSSLGRPEFLRVSRSSLLTRNGRKYLAVGVVHIDPDTKQHLIQFPHEADSGANRIWVPEASILHETQVPVS